MSDKKITIQELKNATQKMSDDRDWNKFHSPKNLSMAISIEAAELMEKFLWLNEQQSYDLLNVERQEIENELADVIIAALAMGNVISADISSIVTRKIAEIEKKYPVEKAKGVHTKYTKL